MEEEIETCPTSLPRPPVVPIEQALTVRPSSKYAMGLSSFTFMETLMLQLSRDIITCPEDAEVIQMLMTMLKIANRSMNHA